MSTNPDPLAVALQLAKEQLDARVASIAQAVDTVAGLGDSLRSLASLFNDVQVSLVTAIQSADRLKALIGQQK